MLKPLGGVPLTGWTWLVLLAGLTAVTAVWWPLRRRPARPRLALLAAGLAVTVLALTLTPGHRPQIGLGACLAEIPDADTLGRVAHGMQGIWNVLLLMPLTASVVLAARARRAVTVATLALAVLLPGAIELVQTLLPGRECNPTDYLDNLLGGLSGLALGLWWNAQLPRVHAAVTRSDQSRPDRSRPDRSRMTP